MRLLIALAALALLLPLASAHAQDERPVVMQPSGAALQQQAPPKQPRAEGRISGTVLCRDTHKPARGATVMAVRVPSGKDAVSDGAFGAMNLMGRVGMDGSYTIQRVPPGEYSVVAILSGYLSPMEELMHEQLKDTAVVNGAAPQPPDMTRMREILRRNGSVSVRGAETERMDVTLERGAAISGRVLYSDGSPATQVAINLEDPAAKNSKRSPQEAMAEAMVGAIFTHQNSMTDDQGRFRVSGIPAGTYRVDAVAPQQVDFGGGGDDDGMGIFFGAMGGGVFDKAALHVYAGDTLHPKAAKTYDLRAGDEVSGVDIVVPIDAFHRVQGTVTATDGRPVNSGDITLTDAADDSISFGAALHEDGTFSFPAVPAGTYTIAAKKARILVRPPNTPDTYPLKNSGAQPSNAFADGTASVIVKDADVSGATVALTEIPVPKDEIRPPMNFIQEGPGSLGMPPPTPPQ